MPKTRIVMLTRMDMEVLMKCAAVFRDIVIESSCGKEACEHCAGNLDIIEDITDVTDKITEMSGIQIQMINVEDIHPMASNAEH